MTQKQFTQDQITDTIRFNVFFGAILADSAGEELSPLQAGIRAAMGERPASLEALREAIDTVLLEHQPAGLIEAVNPVYIDATAAQLMQAISVFAPDHDTDPYQRDTRIRLVEGNETSHSGPGLYACDAEYPDEGYIALFEQPDSDAAAAQQAEALGVELEGDAPALKTTLNPAAAWPFPTN